MTGLRDAVADYLAIRESLGYQTTQPRRLLGQFVGYLEGAGLGTVTTDAALDWATQPCEPESAWWAARLTVVRGFARYLQTIDPSAEVPPAGLVGGKNRRATPYLYSGADVAALMSAAGRLRSPLRAVTYETLIGLLAVTGMRVGEVIALDRGDVDLGGGALVIRHAKFAKTRQVPLHSTTVAALTAYASRRDQLCPRAASPAFFISTTGTRLFYSSFHPVFSGLVRQAGLQTRSPSSRPRPHDLRHSFAVHALLGWQRDGADVHARLPVLSTYLGHTHPGATYWYLSGSPELFALAAQRLEATMEVLP